MKNILNSVFVDFDAFLSECLSFILCTAGLMTDQWHLALEAGPAGLSIAQKHQHCLVMDLSSWLMAWSLFASTLTVGNLRQVPEFVATC